MNRLFSEYHLSMWMKEWDLIILSDKSSRLDSVSDPECKFNMCDQPPGDIDLVMAIKVQLLIIPMDHLCLSRSEHNLTYTKEWSVLIMMKKKHNKIQVKFSHLKTLHNGVDADWRCIFYRLGKFQSPSQGSRKGRNKKAPICSCLEQDLDIYRQNCPNFTFRINPFPNDSNFQSCSMKRSSTGLHSRTPLYIW